MGYIDLHTHSRASDGSDTPTQLINKAADLGIEALALTDHDTLDGLDEAAEAARARGIQFIRGCELSTTTDLGGIHILGLWLPEKCEKLEEFLRRLRAARDKRNQTMIGKLRDLGLNMTLEEVEAKARGSVGRPHMADVMVEKGYAHDRNEAFSIYLGDTGKAYVPKVAPTPHQAVRLLHELGATAVFAHPLFKDRPREWIADLAADLAKSGLVALEAWHSSHNAEQAQWLVALASQLGLGVSGGSDYHGSGKRGLELGIGSAGMRLASDILNNLQDMRKAKGLAY